MQETTKTDASFVATLPCRSSRPKLFRRVRRAGHCPVYDPCLLPLLVQQPPPLTSPPLSSLISYTLPHLAMDEPPSKASLVKWWRSFTGKTTQDSPSSSSLSHSASSPKSKQQPKPSASLPYLPPGRGLERGSDGKGRVFGVSLEQSLQYASVAISVQGP
jgi:hypothetical protein